MASNLKFVEFICDQLKEAGNIRYKSMMGEYLVYVNNKYVIGICNDQVYLKITDKARLLLNEIIEKPMYDGAKPSFLINDIDDAEYLVKIVKVTFEELPEPKQKKSN